MYVSLVLAYYNTVAVLTEIVTQVRQKIFPLRVRLANKCRLTVITAGKIRKMIGRAVTRIEGRLLVLLKMFIVRHKHLGGGSKTQFVGVDRQQSNYATQNIHVSVAQCND